MSVITVDNSAAIAQALRDLSRRRVLVGVPAANNQRDDGGIGNAYGIIYVVTNLVNQKQYVGQTRRTKIRRWRAHVRASLNGSQLPIHHAIRKYGVENFDVLIKCGASNQNELDWLESEVIKLHDTISPGGYNLKSGGASSVYPESSRRKMSEAKLGKPASPRLLAHLQALNASRLGVKRSPEVIAKISASKMGHAVSDELRAKMSENAKKQDHTIQLEAMRRSNLGRYSRCQ